MNNMNILTVSQLNFYIKSLFDGDKNLNNVFLTGEISNFIDHRSGHLYFSLKDEKCVIKCVMFAGYARSLKFEPEDGMKVLLRGRVSVYEVSGQYQFYVEDMQPDGIGALNLAFEQLKNKLSKEGLFDDCHKKQILKFPNKVGVVTSKTGAAIEDIKNIIFRRYPICDIVLCPVLVQGEEASKQILNAIKLFNENDAADVIIVGRGGGSIEDLWAFNDEELARAIFKSNIPIISAVGHETDFTICDFVADLRAPTPSAAAELVVPDKKDLLIEIQNLINYINKNIFKKFQEEKIYLDSLVHKIKLMSPSILLENKILYIDNLYSELIFNFKNKLQKEKNKLSEISIKLDMMSPLKILSRGYSITKREDVIIKSIHQVNKDDEVKIKVSDGEIDCKVI